MERISPELLRSALSEEHAKDSAPLLLGATLHRRNLSAEIVEVEAYGFQDDPASHSYRGQSRRNLAMFGEPGLAYVYVSYGVHEMLNVACRPAGEGSAILIRAARPIAGIEEMRSRRPLARNEFDILGGPGRLTQAMQIDRSHNHIDLFSPNDELWIELNHARIENPIRTKRIGLSPCSTFDEPWRFVHPELRRWASR